MQEGIREPHVVVVSEPTPDGGKAGVRTEVSRELAARMAVEGKARIATEEEAAGFRAEMAEGRRAAEEKLMQGKVQLAVISEAELRALKGSGKSKP